jgi:hypothetical protein
MTSERTHTTTEIVHLNHRGHWDAQGSGDWHCSEHRECSCIPGFDRPGDCQHHAISDHQLSEREEAIARTWGSIDHLVCPACNEYLYPHDDGYRTTVYVGEPFGAGADPFGRPNPKDHPEYWTE